MTTDQIALLVAVALAFTLTIAVCAAVAWRALAHLNRANQSLYLIAREALTSEVGWPELPDITIHTPAPPAPEVHIDLTPDMPTPADTPIPTLPMPDYQLDPTDGRIPRIDTDWTPPAVDPTDETVPG